jgi:hypothetical protein
MAALDSEGRRRRSRVANNLRHHPDRPELVEDDQRILKADALERHIRAMVDEWPPLTAEQRSRLTLLLHGGGRDAVAT